MKLRKLLSRRRKNKSIRVNSRQLIDWLNNKIANPSCETCEHNTGATDLKLDEFVSDCELSGEVRQGFGYLCEHYSLAKWVEEMLSSEYGKVVKLDNEKYFKLFLRNFYKLP